jgi:hypothetical protein
MRQRTTGVEDAITWESSSRIRDRNSMTTPELIERMRRWLITDYRALIFEDDTEILAKRKNKQRSPAATLRAIIAVPTLAAGKLSPYLVARWLP